MTIPAPGAGDPDAPAGELEGRRFIVLVEKARSDQGNRARPAAVLNQTIRAPCPATTAEAGG